MLNKDGLHLFINDGIFLTICCVLDNHTQIVSGLEWISHINMIAILSRIAVKSIL